MESKNKKLRSGYTTGACAAAAAKAATLLVLNAECGVRSNIESVEIPFPDGSGVTFKLHDSGYRVEEKTAFASVIKDAGDDPDVTNGAEIRAEVSLIPQISDAPIVIKGGMGVGRVTKPGLAVPVGEPAINPVPRKMILAAVGEAVAQCGVKNAGIEVTIMVPAGEALAKKTLNHRLGIVGGISILGTTGVVRPLSTEAWTATIAASMDVARAAGLTTVVLSSGRTSEKAHMKAFHFPEEAYSMMGDHLEFSLLEAKKHRFGAIHLCAQWAKMIKAAMGTPQTHVSHGALDAQKAAEFLAGLGIALPQNKTFNTSREIYDHIINTFSLRERAGVRAGQDPSPPNLPLKGRQDDTPSALSVVCRSAKTYCERVSGGIPVTVHLVSYEGEILAQSE